MAATAFCVNLEIPVQDAALLLGAGAHPGASRAKLRQGSFFPALLEPRRRIDQALWAVVMEAYVHGVSTRKVDDLVVALGIDAGISKSEVSRICAELDAVVSALRDRRLDHVRFPYVFLDATYVKAHEGASVVSKAIVVATGVIEHGQREVLGLAVGDSEDGAFWTAFLRSLRALAILTRRWEEAGRPKDGWVFPALRGADKPVQPTWVTGTFERRMVAAGFEPIHFHDLRHIAILRMLNGRADGRGGMDPLTVSQIVGHKTPEITLRLYGAGIITGRQAEAMDSIDFEDSDG